MNKYKQRLLELAESLRLGKIEYSDGKELESRALKLKVSINNKNVDELIFLISKLEPKSD